MDLSRDYAGQDGGQAPTRKKIGHREWEGNRDIRLSGSRASGEQNIREIVFSG